MELKKKYDNLVNKLKYIKIKNFHPKWHVEAGYCLLMLKDHDRAISHFKEGLKLSQELNQIEIEAISQYYLGLCLREDGNLQKAEEHFAISYDKFGRSKNLREDVNQITCFSQLCLFLGDIYNNNRSFNIAIEIFEEGIKILNEYLTSSEKRTKKHKNKLYFLNEIHTLLNFSLGMCYSKIGKIEDALKVLDEVDSNFLNDDTLVLWVNTKAILLMHHNETEKGLYLLLNIKKQFIEKSKLLVESGDKRNLRKILGFISVIDENIKKLKEL